MTDYDADHDGDQTPEDGGDIWPHAWDASASNPLNRLIILMAICGLAGWLLIQVLTS